MTLTDKIGTTGALVILLGVSILLLGSCYSGRYETRYRIYWFGGAVSLLGLATILVAVWVS